MKGWLWLLGAVFFLVFCIAGELWQYQKRQRHWREMEQVLHQVTLARKVYSQVLLKEPIQWQKCQKQMEELAWVAPLTLRERILLQWVQESIQKREKRQLLEHLKDLLDSLEQKQRKKIHSFSSFSLPFSWAALLVTLGGLSLLLWSLPREGKRAKEYFSWLLQGKERRAPFLMTFFSFAKTFEEELKKHWERENKEREKLEKKWRAQYEREREAKEKTRREVSALRAEKEELQEKLAKVEQEQRDLLQWKQYLEGCLDSLPLSLVAAHESGNLLLVYPSSSPLPFEVGKKWYSFFSNQSELQEFWQAFSQKEEEKVVAYWDNRAFEVLWKKGKRQYAIGCFYPIDVWEELQSRHLFFEESLRALPLPLWLFDGEGNPLWRNPAGKALGEEYPTLEEEIQELFRSNPSWVVWRENYGVFLGSWTLQGEKVGGCALVFSQEKWKKLEERWRWKTLETLFSLPLPLAFLSEEGKVEKANSVFSYAFSSPPLGKSAVELLSLPENWQELKGYKLSKKAGKPHWEVTLLPWEKGFLLVGVDLGPMDELYESHEKLLGQIGRYERMKKTWEQEKKKLEQELEKVKQKLSEQSQTLAFLHSPPESEDGSTLIAPESQGKEDSLHLSQRIFQKTFSPKEPPSSFFLGELVEEIEEELLDYLGERQNLFEWRGNPKISLYTQRQALKTLLLQMLVYSSKHTYGGKIRLIGKGIGDKIYLAVEDNGPIRSATEMALLEEEKIENLPEGPITRIIQNARLLGAKLRGKSTPKKTRLILILPKRAEQNE